MFCPSIFRVAMGRPGSVGDLDTVCRMREELNVLTCTYARSRGRAEGRRLWQMAAPL